MKARLDLPGTLFAVISVSLSLRSLCTAQANNVTTRQQNVCKIESEPLGAGADQVPTLTIVGLSQPAVVSGAISISVTGPSAPTPITYCLDGNAMEETALTGDPARPLLLRNVTPGEHFLSAVGSAAEGRFVRSERIQFDVVPSMNDQFSATLTPYALQPSAGQPLPDLLQHITTPGAELTQEETDIRSQVAAMYRNYGFDLSLDYQADQSKVLSDLLPKAWAQPMRNRSVLLSEQFSPDAPFYKTIPPTWPRVKLPHGYLSTVQLNTNQGGDGIGYGVTIAQDDSPHIHVTSQWYAQVATRRVVDTRATSGWSRALPSLTAGDRHMLFIDPGSKTFVSAYKTSVDTKTGDPVALYASSPTSFDSLGDHGGSTAAGFAEIPLLLWPGETTREEGEIHHALGGPVGRTWAARIYPATSRDAGMLTSSNTCPGKGKLLTNNGLVPYGGIIQLDPSLDLAQLKLSRPARRILRALQVYGYYVMDFGCADLDIYTAVDEKEFTSFGGLYGWNAEHPGIQDEISKVLTSATLYVVAPLVKRP